MRASLRSEVLEAQDVPVVEEPAVNNAHAATSVNRTRAQVPESSRCRQTRKVRYSRYAAAMTAMIGTTSQTLNRSGMPVNRRSLTIMRTTAAVITTSRFAAAARDAALIAARSAGARARIAARWYQRPARTARNTSMETPSNVKLKAGVAIERQLAQRHEGQAVHDEAGDPAARVLLERQLLRADAG